MLCKTLVYARLSCCLRSVPILKAAILASSMCIVGPSLAEKCSVSEAIEIVLDHYQGGEILSVSLSADENYLIVRLRTQRKEELVVSVDMQGC